MMFACIYYDFFQAPPKPIMQALDTLAGPLASIPGVEGGVCSGGGVFKCGLRRGRRLPICEAYMHWSFEALGCWVGHAGARNERFAVHKSSRVKTDA
jgi:hypothetical protein